MCVALEMCAQQTCATHSPPEHACSHRNKQFAGARHIYRHSSKKSVSLYTELRLKCSAVLVIVVFCIQLSTCCILTMSLDSSYNFLSAPGLRKSQKITGQRSSNNSSFAHDTFNEATDVRLFVGPRIGEKGAIIQKFIGRSRAQKSFRSFSSNVWKSVSYVRGCSGKRGVGSWRAAQARTHVKM